VRTIQIQKKKDNTMSNIHVGNKTVAEMIDDILARTDATKQIVEENGIKKITIVDNGDRVRLTAELGNDITLSGSWRNEPKKADS
jgi:hypothetical protein